MSSTWLKYAIPAVLLVAVGLGLSSLANEYGMPWLQGCTGILYVIAFVLLLQAVLLIVDNWRDGESIRYQAMKRAEHTTEPVLLAQHLAQMHPAAAEVFKSHGMLGWSVIPGKNVGDLPDHIIYGTRVTIEFARDFLLASNDEYVCPSQKFSNEGAKYYAPEMVGKENWVTDREQYDEFRRLLESLGRLYPPHGNLPAAWRKPWSPITCAATLGIQLETPTD